MKMRIDAVNVVASIIVFLILAPLDSSAQVPAGQPQLAPVSTQYSTEQLDQMLAPVALYPDPLLAQILMAATYPLEIVQADRWLQEPNNTALKGTQLSAALEQQPWDPSVKSLVPFPQVLHMMDGNLTWTEQLGDAFLAGQPAVMDSVQRLRQKAKAAGRLRSSPQEVISDQGSYIAIEPPTPETVYVPVYDPSVVYGIWPYPGYPPFYFPAFFGGVVIGGLGFGWLGIGIDLPLWGWGNWDWGHHRINVDGNRFNTINAHRSAIASGEWQHDPSHRAGVPYRDTTTRAKFQGAIGTSAARRSFRGYQTTATEQTRQIISGNHTALPAARIEGPQIRTTPSQVIRQSPRPVQTFHASPPPAFESFGRGADVESQAQRGHQSRQSVPAMTLRSNGGGAAQQSAHGSGGRRR